MAALLIARDHDSGNEALGRPASQLFEYQDHPLFLGHHHIEDEEVGVPLRSAIIKLGVAVRGRPEM